MKVRLLLQLLRAHRGYPYLGTLNLLNNDFSAEIFAVLTRWH